MSHANQSSGPRAGILGTARRRWALLAAGVGTAAAVAVGGAVFAASPASGGTGFWGLLASKLGVSVTTLKSDVASVKGQQFQAYAQSHHLTPQQIAAGQKRIQHAQWRVVPAHAFWRHAWRPLVLHTTATTLKMTPAAVRAALRGGTTLGQLATAHGSSPAALQQAVQSALSARLAKLVASGKMSAARQAAIEKGAARMLPHLMTRSWGHRPSA